MKRRRDGKMSDEHTPLHCVTCSLQSSSELGKTELRSCGFHLSWLSGDLNAAPAGFPFFILKNDCRLMVTDRLILYLECFSFHFSVFQFWTPFGEKQPVQTSPTWTACGAEEKVNPGLRKSLIWCCNSILKYFITLLRYLLGVWPVFPNVCVLKCLKKSVWIICRLLQHTSIWVCFL